jgi:5-methylcytosine-specific restriction protein A
MQAIGRDASSKSDHGNATKRICLQLSRELADGQVLSILRAISVERDFRSEERLPISELESVTPEHLFNAVQSLLGGHVDHGFGPSTDFDVLLEDGTRLPPKAIFGVAATEALGFVVKPRNFAAGVDSACFRILSDAGYRIVPKDTTPVDLQDTEPTDQDWEEGTPKLKAHLRRERSASLRQAKISEFRRKHQGRLFCERCNENPAEKYKTALADSCIEVHHDKTLVSEMQVGHRTRLEDLKCLCANCHRLTHREMRARQVA